MQFSNAFVTVSFLFLFCCLMCPVLYYIYFVYKKRFNHLAMLGGIAAFLMFGYLLTSLLLGSVIPTSLRDQMGEVPYALVRTLLIGICEAGGMYITLRLLSSRYPGNTTPISFGLGYTLINMLLVGGVNGFMRLSQAMAVNDNGLDAVLDTVDASQREALRATLTELSELPIGRYAMEVAEFVCFFLISVAIARIVWYAIDGGKLPASNRFLGLGILLRFAAELAYYMVGRVENYVMAEVIYYIVTLVIVAVAVLLSIQRDDKEKVRAGPLNRRLL